MSDASVDLKASSNKTRQPRTSSGAPLPALTGLRFFAAFYVVLVHSVPWLDSRFRLPSFATTFLGNGVLAVCLFFLLSGFILSYTYAGKSSGALHRKRFWVARFARIYPVYVLSLLLVLPFAFRDITRPQALSVLLMVQTWNPLSSQNFGAWNYPAWSLSVEAFFYLCFPFLQDFLWRLSRRSLFAVVIITSLVCVFLKTPLEGLGVWQPGTIMRWVPLPILRIPEFILGMGLGNIFIRYGSSSRKSVFIFATTITAILLLCLPIGSYVSMVVIPFGLLIYLLASSRNPITSLLSLPVTVLLGGASYSIYLLQLPVRDWVRTLLPGGSSFLNLLNVLATPIVLVLFSILVFRFWEEPLRKAIRGRLARTRQSLAAQGSTS
jgi:peptidoglycan/LPS O-acetylase OafA/YrhL